MDFITSLPETQNGFDSILVVVDRFSKMAHFLPTTNNVTAPQVASLFIAGVVKLHGLPESLVSDRDPKFTGFFWKELTKSLKVKLNLSTAYHPQSDGQTERTNRTLEQILRNYVCWTQNDWDKALPVVEFAYNSAVHNSTGFSPFQIVYHAPPVFPSSFSSLTTNPSASEFLLDLETISTVVRDRILKAQLDQSTQNDSRISTTSFKEGDYVYLSSENLSPFTLGQAKIPKLAPRWIGPYKIIKNVNPVAFELELPPNLKIHPVFHSSNLKSAVENHDFIRPVSRPPPIVLDHQDEYEVEKVLDSRIRRGKQEYLIKWVGYPNEDNTWEPEEHLKNAKEKLREYLGTL